MTVAVNAIGNYVLPMLIFPSFHFKNHMSTGAITSSIGGAKPTGWSRVKLFVDCMKHCITCDRPSMEGQFLFILDNN